VRLALALASSALVAAPAPAGADTVVDAGALRARLQERPFALAFEDARGRPVLGGGRLLGDRARSLRALRVRSGRGWLTATVRTAGGPLRLRVARAGAGVMSVTVRGPGGARSLGASFPIARRELFTGFGERSNAVNQRGRAVLNYTADGPFLERDRPLAGAVVPDWAEVDRPDATYYPIPWLLSSRGYGVLVDNDETSRFRLDRGGRWTAEAEAERLALRVFAGPRPADALARFTAATGRQPAPPAAWVYGPWVQTGQPNVVPLEDEQRIFRTLREADAPVSAAETHMRFLPCGVHRFNEAYERERTVRLHAFGLAQLTYFSPHLCTSYQPLFDEATAAGALQRGADGRPLIFSAFVGGQGPSGFSILPLAQFDFTAPAAKRIYTRLLREAVDQGKDGWMEDFGEWTSPQVASADGTPAARIHNRYPRDYHCAVRDIVRRFARPLVRFQRSGWTGAARCSVNVWGGDPTTVWGFDGLRSAVTQALTIGMSGVARWGSDIGGYNSFGAQERLTPELLQRWIQLGAVSGVMRTKRSGIAIPGYERPQVFDSESLPIWRRYAKLHTQLLPYIQAADAVHRATGLPLMRHGLLTHPGDRRAVRADDQFMFGPDLLAAPVLAPAAVRRRLYAPRGRWVDLWRSARYVPRDGSLRLGRARLVRGGRALALPAPRDELPLLVRAGAVIPLLAADVDTLAPYRGRGVVRLRDRLSELQLLAFPRGRSRAGMGARPERLQSVEGEREWRLTIRGKRVRRYRLQASLATLKRPFAPSALRVAGRPLRSWSYDPRRRVLRASFRLRSGTLTVR
jgi:alpha-glucosidase (family GH31 glycosyl hydrolase)